MHLTPGDKKGAGACSQEGGGVKMGGKYNNSLLNGFNNIPIKIRLSQPQNAFYCTRLKGVN